MGNAQSEIPRNAGKMGAMWPISFSVGPQWLCPISLNHRVAPVPFKPTLRRAGVCLTVFQLSKAQA